MPEANLSFNDIYKRYKNLVYNLSLSYVQNTEDAQDITQEVFVKIYQKLHFFNEEKASVKTWIYKITINQCLDFIKAKKTNKRFAFITRIFNTEPSSPELDIPHFDHPGVQMENKEQLKILFEHINNLPPQQKTAIILVKIEQQSQKETALIMGLTVKAVESLLTRAKQNLLKKLKHTEGL
nr:RNA polymerase sigma factor [uncultured Pedobacter sp.]